MTYLISFTTLPTQEGSGSNDNDTQPERKDYDRTLLLEVRLPLGTALRPAPGSLPGLHLAQVGRATMIKPTLSAWERGKAIAKTAERLLESLEDEAKPNYPARLTLPPYDGPKNDWPLRRRELLVFAPGSVRYGYDEDIIELDYQYIDTRRDEFCLVGLDMSYLNQGLTSRANALRFLQGYIRRGEIEARHD